MRRRYRTSRGYRKFRLNISIRLSRLDLTIDQRKAELRKAVECFRRSQKYYPPSR